MSFILDALKKSESERQRQHAPGIANIPESGRQPYPAKWPWVVAGLLAINFIVLAVIMLKPDTPAATSQASADVVERAEARAVTAGGSETRRATPEPVARSSAQTSAAPAQSLGAQTALPAPAAPPATFTDGLPSLRELQAAGQIQLPEMHLDIHVYSGQPDDRFVFVNMSKYKEGATLREGPTISEITPDGVVLDYFGTRFLLPRE